MITLVVPESPGVFEFILRPINQSIRWADSSSQIDDHSQVTTVDKLWPFPIQVIPTTVNSFEFDFGHEIVIALIGRSKFWYLETSVSRKCRICHSLQTWFVAQTTEGMWNLVFAHQLTSNSLFLQERKPVSHPSYSCVFINMCSKIACSWTDQPIQIYEKQPQQ